MMELTGFNPVLTLAVMTVSIIGVLHSFLNKRKIRCACLGAVFNLLISSFTIIEDALMIGMSALMPVTAVCLKTTFYVVCIRVPVLIIFHLSDSQRVHFSF